MLIKKHILYCFICFLFFEISNIYAQQKTEAKATMGQKQGAWAASQKRGAWAKKRKKRPPKNVLQIAPLIGTDVGGGVPYGNIPKYFRPYPKLNLSLGLWFNYIISYKWQIGLNMTYKTVTLSADANMSNEYFKGPITNNQAIYYSGIASQTMSFTMLEFPLLAKYGFGSRAQYRLVFGGYGAWILQRSFSVIAKTGYQGSSPYATDVNIIDPNNPVHMNFDYALRNWEAGLAVGYEQSITPRLNVDFIIYGGVNSIFSPGKQFLAYGLFPMRLGLHVNYSLFEFAPNASHKFRFVYK